MMRVPPLRRRHKFGDVFFHTARRRRQRQPEPMRHAKHVRVDRKRRFLERDRHHDVRRLAPDAG